MPPTLLCNLDELDLNSVEADKEDIRSVNPQRYEMEQLDGIIHYNPDDGIVVGFKDVGEEEFWKRGHIPGNPLMPGVLMCEAAAQLCSYYYGRNQESDRFLGFAGMQDVKFRAPVKPGNRLILLAKSTEMRRRRATFDTQGVVDDRVVFQAGITGMPMS